MVLSLRLTLKIIQQALAYLEIDTLGHMIDSIVFEIEVRDSFSEKIIRCKTSSL